MQIRDRIPSTLMLIAASSVLLFTACDKQGQAAGHPGGQQAPDVGVYTVKTKSVVLQTELAGRIAPNMISEVRPQVTGIIQKRLFTEGSNVKAGAVLYQIDPATYQAAYNSAKAAKAKAEANLASSRARANRYKELVEINAISKQEYDDADAALKLAEADVQATAAAVETARINLAYTTVTSPITGRISKSDITPGALVTANQPNPLTTVQQLDPIYVDVTQASTEWLRLKQDLEQGKLKNAGENQAEVELILPDGSTYSEKGILKFSDVTVDQGTGSINIRAQFKNPKGDLLPGMYVRAKIVEGVRTEAIMVPQQGISRDHQGNATALVVAPDGTVSMRILKTERAVGNEWLVSEGLQPGDRVIVEGLQRVRLIPGAPAPVVTPQEKDVNGKAPAAPAGKPGEAAPQPAEKPAQAS